MMMNESVKDCNEFHDKAISLADQAVGAKKEGKESDALELYRQAYEFEMKAAMILFEKQEVEPSRSVLFRSAAWLAFHAGKYREAERMAACGLMGNPPETIVKELREVMVSTLSKLDALTPAHAA